MKRFFAVILFLVFFLGGFLFYFQLAPNLTDSALREFTVNEGDSLALIAARLQNNHLVRNRFVFIALSYYHGLNRKLQAGIFKLSPATSTSQIIFKLSRGGSRDYWLKIIGGSRIEEINPSITGAIEGHLYPDNYLIPEDYTPVQILSVIKDNFQKKFTEAKIGASSSLDDNQSLILASLLEREARLKNTKQVVAGILLNRLKIGMALQVDATVQYARDSRLPHPLDYWLPVAKSDLKIPSLFNTYLHPGFPPEPICNPGFDSLYAAFHPTPSDYLFYITDDSGQIHYAKTLTEHNANIAKYLH